MRLLPLLAAVLLVGCQTAPPTYRDLTEEYAAGEAVSPARLRTAFMAAPDLPSRMERLAELESQALAVVEDEPLKLGSIGSAILDTYVGSLTGHYVLARFYDHVSNPKAEFHEEWVERIRRDMEAAGDGYPEPVLPTVTPAEARVYALSRGWAPVGSIYDASGEDDGVPFSLLLQVSPKAGALKSLRFDLSGMYHSMEAEFRARRITPSDDGDPVEFNPFSLVGYLARQGDSAAQTAVGALLAQEGEYDNAVDWLRAASRTGNLVANTLLAQIHLQRARLAESEDARDDAMDQVMENYLHAIALGSGDAMYALGVLYVNGHYGEDNRISGIPLLEQARDLDHSEATMFLAHLHYAGEVVDRDLDAARGYYVQAADLGNEFARKSYARFLLDREAGQPGDPRAVTWLEELADQGEAESMLLLGNLHARGVGTRRSVRQAVSWFRQAVDVDPQDANIVNEVAWTLAVSDQQDLRRASYARRIMSRLMEDNAAARERPEYLDTWAATYAATGDFERAVAVQREAVDVAEEADYADVLDILRDHLEAFRAGETISETVP